MKLQSFVPTTIQGQPIIQQQGQIIGFSQNQQVFQNGVIGQNQGTQQQFVPKKVIEHYSYQLNDQIGKGYSSKVFKGKDERTDDEVAVKVIDMKMMSNEVQLFLLQNEISVMKKLALTGNINILKLNDVFQTANNTYIITEICNQGDLRDLLKKYNTLEESQAVKILKHIINGYRELAKHRIVHRDIKPANILINDGIPKLADFGFAKDIDAPPYKYYYNVGTPMYMCPQSLQKNEYSIKSDIWSIGVLYFELLYGVTPWTAETEKELHHKVCNVPVQFPKHIKISNESIEFIRGCLQVDERRRFSLEQIENHPLMKLNFKKDIKAKNEGSLKNLPSSQQQQIQQQQQAPHNMKRPSSQQQLPSSTNIPNLPSSIHQQESGKENSPPSKENLGSHQNLQHQRKGHKTEYRRAENDLQGGQMTAAAVQTPNIPMIPTSTIASNGIQVQQGSNQVSTPINGIGGNQDFNILRSEGRKLTPNMQQIPPYISKEEMALHEQQQNDQIKTNYSHSQNHADVVGNIPSSLGSQQQQAEESKNTQPIEKTNDSLQNNNNQTVALSANNTAASNNNANELQNNDKIILAQINLCRFLFRLSKLAEESNIIESPMLKEKLVFLILKNIMVKITKLNNMNESNQNSLNLSDWSNYTKAESFKRFQIVINEYYTKYQTHFKQRWENGIFSQQATKTELQKDKKFDAIFDDNFMEFESFYIILQSFLRFTIREINHIAKSRVKNEQDVLPNDLEQSIVLLDYLITFYQLTNLILDHFTNYLYFADHSKIEQIAEGRPVRLNKTHYAQIRSKIYTLEI
ncbi:hypothetical protein ABPG74_005256 [Tetrahymena malaccensis]